MTRGLGFRMIAMLSIALLPLGLIAVYQTSRVANQIETISDAAVIGLTSEAALSQRQEVLRAFGVSEALGQSILTLLDEPEACNALLRRYISNNPVFIFAGFVRSDGEMPCASKDAGRNVRGLPSFERYVNSTQPEVTSVDEGVVTGASLVLVTTPVTDDGQIIGYMALSLPRNIITAYSAANLEGEPVDLLTFNTSGEILTASGGLESARNSMPEGVALTDFIGRDRAVFKGRTEDGRDRKFVVVPLIANTMYALGSWSPDQSLVQSNSAERLVLAFPLLMWLASLGVAYLAVHRLVIRYIRELRSKMRRFASGNRTIEATSMGGAPIELEEMNQTFLDMAETITRDEAEMENGLHEQTVLLKEVHHRVKNNLQLISSIMNMQMRKTKSPEVRGALKRVQDRVMVLAAIHRNLYQASVLSKVRADTLLDEIINQMLVLALPSGSNVKIIIDLDRATLYPDQAVPLSLLAIEAATNALKYIGKPADGSQPYISVSLRRVGEKRLELEVANSTGVSLENESNFPSSGLGAQLIKAFATQLGANAVQSETDGLHRLTVTFKIAEFVPEDMSSDEAA